MLLARSQLTSAPPTLALTSSPLLSSPLLLLPSCSLSCRAKSDPRQAGLNYPCPAAATTVPSAHAQQQLLQDHRARMRMASYSSSLRLPRRCLSYLSKCICPVCLIRSRLRRNCQAWRRAATRTQTNPAQLLQLRSVEYIRTARNCARYRSRRRFENYRAVLQVTRASSSLLESARASSSLLESARASSRSLEPSGECSSLPERASSYSLALYLLCPATCTQPRGLSETVADQMERGRIAHEAAMRASAELQQVNRQRMYELKVEGLVSCAL